MNIGDATRGLFVPHLESTFQVSAGGELVFEATLIDVSPMGETVGPNGRRPFSLVLRGPQDAAPAQAIYRVDHQELGAMDLFLVPIGPDDEGMKFEAVFT